MFYCVGKGKNGPRLRLGKTDIYRQHLKTLSETTRETFLKNIRTPLMALAGTTEHVMQGGVDYRLPQGQVKLRFLEDAYEVVEGHEYLSTSRIDILRN